MGYLSSADNKHSSMRLNLMLASIACFALLMIVGAYILIMALKHEGVNDWTGMGVFALGLLGGLTGVSFAKSQQKKYENGSNGTTS